MGNLGLRTLQKILPWMIFCGWISILGTLAAKADPPSGGGSGSLPPLEDGSKAAVQACTSLSGTAAAECAQDCPPSPVSATFVGPPGPDPKCFAACQTTLNSCVSAVQLASSACLTNLSPWIQKGASYVEGALALASATGVVDQCSTMGDVMNDIQLVLGAYGIACGGLKLRADLACPKAAPDPKSGANYKNSSIANSCNKAIGAYSLSLATGAAGVLESLLRGGQDSSCQNTASAGTTATPAGTTTSTYDCNLAVNTNAVVCVCQANPSLAECSVLSNSGCSCATATTGSAPVCTCTSTISSGAISTAQGSATPAPVTTTTAATTTATTVPASTYTGVTGDPNSTLGTDSGGTSTGTAIGSSGLTGSTVPTTLEAKKPTAGSDNSGNGDSYSGGGGAHPGGSGASPYAAYQPGGALDPTKKSAAQKAYEQARAEIRTAASYDNFSAVSSCINVTCPSAANTFGVVKP